MATSNTSTTTIGTHSGAFQADEALGVWLLKCLPQYRDAILTRSRNVEILHSLHIVIDVAGTYNHSKLRYDHHQRGFFETFDGENRDSRDGGRPDVTGPESATGKFQTKLSASGLVYKHYGRGIIGILHPSLVVVDDSHSHSPQLEWVYHRMYKDFMEGLDADDNGIEIADVVRYKQGTSLPVRVGRLNQRWNDDTTTGNGTSEDERFAQASGLCGTEFSEALEYIVNCQLPARKVVEEALQTRTQVHSSGEVIRFTNGGCPWKTHLYELERSDKEINTVAQQIKFVLYEDNSKMWRVQAVTVEGTAFTNRVGLLEPWRGIRDEELCQISGIDGCKFVHASGFIGGNATYEGALAMALQTIEASTSS